ncbi:helicase-related protein [Singulisphaera sp. GP187]|uniref:helicase-related protein n=1 Tax=Singulisphaera sp. GP187 TaxID=1882752 RepID=UPI00135647E6|nr:DEAD/DEAH box helicase [Singulisphaera sp. GP187]
MRSLKLQTSAEYGDWSAAGHRPSDVPASPNKIYEEWVGWADWLGTGGPRPKRLSKATELLPFEEARAFVQGLSLSSQRDYFEWSKSEERPPNIPSNPRQAYGAQWTNWKDWLGLRLATIRPFAEAREFARSLELRTRRDWVEYSQRPDFPRDIPVYPESYYTQKLWQGWSDWLGVYQEWNHLSIASFLDSLKLVVEELQEVDLYLILSRNGMLKRRWDLSNSHLLRGLIGVRTAEEVERLKGSVVTSERRGDGSAEQAGVGQVSDVVDESDLELGRRARLGTLKNLEQLRSLDRIAELRITDDAEIIEFLIENRVAALWQAFFDETPGFTVEGLLGAKYGDYAGRARDRFLEEYRSVISLPLPPEYAFTVRGEWTEPNLMQRLTALRLLRLRRLGNWSGVGAGKTNAAIFASGVMNAGLTVVLAANATLEGWKTAILGMFPDARVHVKDPLSFSPMPEGRNFLVLNYESFQQDWTEKFVPKLTDGHRIDFLILDEVQLARQRMESRESYRREMVEELVVRATTRNPEIRVLGMSATPVVNNLYEAKRMLELVLGQDLKDLPVSSSLANAINVHMLLKRVGLRHRPNYEIQTEIQTPFLDGMHLLDELQRVAAGNILALEQAILGPKLAFLSDVVRPGTMIYTHYVSKIIDRIAEVVEGKGLTVGRYTGDDKTGLSDFKERKVDVLIGSAPIGTGVDGLQHVCDRLVFMSLPWTHAEYEQIIGRIKRKGSVFDKIEVLIPMVALREDHAGIWSWDDLRKRCIEYKRTLADAALDGTIPLDKIMSKEEMHRRSIAALHEWIDRVKGRPPSPAEPANPVASA